MEGIGTKFYYSNGIIQMHVLFENSKLNGPLIFYNHKQKIEYIANFKKGKFKGYLFHKKAKNYKHLKKLNKSAIKPIRYMLITM